MRVFAENLGPFHFKSFLFAPGRVSEELMKFCATHRKLRLVPAEPEGDPSGACWVLGFEPGNVARARQILSGFPWITHTLGHDVTTDLFRLDPAPDIVLIYIPLYAESFS